MSTTDCAAYPEVVDVPAHHQQRICSSHASMMTRRSISVQPRLKCGRHGHLSGIGRDRPYPVRARTGALERRQPCRSQLTRGSDRSSSSCLWFSGCSGGRWCWQSHQVPPRHSSCRRSRHAWQIMSPLSPAGRQAETRPQADPPRPSAALPPAPPCAADAVTCDTGIDGGLSRCLVGMALFLWWLGDPGSRPGAAGLAGWRRRSRCGVRREAPPAGRCRRRGRAVRHRSSPLRRTA
jgi:hypothetical protein